MASWFREKDFSRHLLSFMVRDRNFMKKCGSLLSAKDFRPARDETKERYIVATLALEYWNKYKSPIGGMLRGDVEAYCRKNHIEGKAKKPVNSLVDSIQSGERLVAVEAMEQRVLDYLRDKKIKDSIEQLVIKQEEGTLDADYFITLAKELSEYSGKVKRTSSSYLEKDQLEHRIARRSKATKEKRPLLFLPGFDSRSPAIGRGDLGLFLAPYKKGKSLALAHVADGYAKQGLNVIYITLEDSKEEVEDRMDAALAYMPIQRLNQLPNKLRKRFKKFSARISGRIRIVDATEDSLTVQDIEQIYDDFRDQGFTADVLVIDYDDELVSKTHHKGESARRMAFAEIYRDLRKLAARKSCIIWTAAQTKKVKDSVKVITADMASEDISKIRKATLVIGIGQGESHLDARYMYVAAFKRGPSRFGWEIMSNPSYGLLYDEELTHNVIKMRQKMIDNLIEMGKPKKRKIAA
jgi:KaiC/GvpD/RAD55 family RecA-like ATPase